MDDLMKFISYICVFVTLIVGLVVAVAWYQDAYLNTLLNFHGSDIFISKVDGPLTKGKIIQGEVKAKFNNFGTLSLSIDTFNRTNNDIIVFQMKEKGTDRWIVFNKYFTDRFPTGYRYPFGFPVIPDSKGKTYVFEIYSVNGTRDNAIGFNYGYHTTASHYIFPVQVLKTDKSLFKGFLKEKMLNFASDVYTYPYFFMFTIPGLFIIVVIKIKNYLVLRQIGIFMCIYLMLAYLLIPLSINSNLTIYIFLVCLLISLKIGISSRYGYAVALFFLIQVPLYLLLRMDVSASKSAVQVFYSMVTAVILSAKEFNLVSLKSHIV